MLRLWGLQVPEPWAEKIGKGMEARGRTSSAGAGAVLLISLPGGVAAQGLNRP